MYYPEFYESVLESARSEWQKNGIKLHPFEVARMIPQDGRIDLAYNLWWRQILDGLRWQTRKPTREGSLQAEAVDTSTDTNTLRQQFMAKEGKEEVRRLSCFLVDFLKHGEFGVWDFSPRILHSPDENTSRYVSYVKHIIVATSYSSFEGHVYGITQPKSEYLRTLGLLNALMLTSFRRLDKGDLYPFWHPLKDCPNDTFPTSRGTAAWNRVMFVFSFF